MARAISFRFAWPLLGLLGIGIEAAADLPQRINDTGLDSCYTAGEATTAVDCADPAWPGQDATSGRDSVALTGTLPKIGAGRLGFDFSKLSARGAALPLDAAPGTGPDDWACTRDNVTGLIWAIHSDAVDWLQARRAAGAANADGGLCGHYGWRLPSVRELQQLVDYGSAAPSIDPDFLPATAVAFHWTAERAPRERNWVVNFHGGQVNPLARGKTAMVRLVTGGDRFGALIDNGDGTVTDPRSGLMWDRCSVGQFGGTQCQGVPQEMTWQQALQRVHTLNQQNWRGHADWRLPNVKELASLVRRDGAQPAIDAARFPNTAGTAYWTSTSNWHVVRMAWAVFFSEGNVFAMDKTALARMRPVRTASAAAEGLPRDGVFADDLEAPPPLPVQQTLPVLSIATAGAAPIDREVYVDAQMTLEGGGFSHGGALQIRGRGNSTWGFDKKPYRIKLDQKLPLLGMPSSKHWVLLANHSDKTMLRNEVAFEAGRRFGMAWTPRSRFVDVHLNGHYLGVYQLTEHIRIDRDRVNIPELGPGDIAEPAISGGYLLEADGRRDCAPWVQFDTDWMPFCIDNPDDETLVPEQYNYIVHYVRSTEAAIYGPLFTDPTVGYAAWLDTASFIDWYLVNELMKNPDARDGSSIWNFKDRGGKFSRGPLWDFDISAGNLVHGIKNDPYGWWIRGGHWYARLFEDPAFHAAVRARWDALKTSQIDTLLDAIDTHLDTYGTAFGANFAPWPVLTEILWANAVVAGSYEGEIAYLQDWLTQRIAWIDANL
jgi:hypothetical protein